MQRFPILHVVTDDIVLARADFVAVARALLETGGHGLAFHLRGHATSSRRLHELGSALAQAAAASGTALLVNDRIDVALTVGAAGVQLGRRSIAVELARSLVGARMIGYSAHSAEDAAHAERSGTDFVILGTIYPTASHPSAEASGPGLVRETADRVSGPVIAIGGVTPDRAVEVVAAGAYGAAVLGGVWSAEDPVASAREYLSVLARAADR